MMHQKPAFVLAALALGLPAALICAQPGPQGCAWEVAGSWRVNGMGADLKAGDLVAPGSLVTGKDSSTGKLIILLPDGQRLFLECHDAPSCARGFRLPALTELPDEETVVVFRQISAQRAAARAAAAPGALHSSERPAPGLLRAEAVAALEDDGAVNLAAALKALPPGNYRLVAKTGAALIEQSFRWDAGQKTLALPLKKTGLYRLSLYGSLNNERMRLSLLVVQRPALKSANEKLNDLREKLADWNEHSPGWPTHEVLALYLDVLGANAAAWRENLPSAVQ